MKGQRIKIGLVALVVIITVWFFDNTEFRSLPDDFEVTAVVSSDNARVTDVLWYEQYSGKWLGLKRKPVYLSIEVVIENLSDRPIEVNRRTVVFTQQYGRESKRRHTKLSGGHFPYLILFPDESRPLWVTEVLYPDKLQAFDWKSIEVQIEMSDFTNDERCVKHWDDIEIFQAGYDAEGNYEISGRVGKYLPFEDFDRSTVFVSFYDKAGSFIGRRNIEVDEPEFTEVFDPNERPFFRRYVYLAWYGGGYMLEEIDSYQVHFIQQIDRYDGCPNSNGE